jgi:hypothetical protein
MINDKSMSTAVAVLMQEPWAGLLAHDIRTVKVIFNSSKYTVSSGKVINE